MPQSHSLAGLAAKLGVSTMSVSLALRGKPGVSDALRERILAAAREHGYQPDPVATELMSIMRARRIVKSEGNVIAFVTRFEDTKRLEEVATFRAFFEGAVRRGRDYGYTVEAFHARAPGMTGRRLSQILQARGVRGLLIGPRWLDESPAVDLDWAAFSSVLIGEVYHRPSIYRVCNHHAQASCLTLHRLTERGYHRIAVTFSQPYERSRGYDFMQGVDQFGRESDQRFHIVVWRYQKWDGSAFAAWAREHDIQAVVSHDPHPYETVRSLKTSSGIPVGYANLDVPAGSPWAGINQHSDAIGETGMELLRQLLLAGERGAVLHPQIVLIDGSWVEGTTAPGLGLDASASPAPPPFPEPPSSAKPERKAPPRGRPTPA